MGSYGETFVEKNVMLVIGDSPAWVAARVNEKLESKQWQLAGPIQIEVRDFAHWASATLIPTSSVEVPEPPEEVRIQHPLLDPTEH